MTGEDRGSGVVPRETDVLRNDNGVSSRRSRDVSAAASASLSRSGSGDDDGANKYELNFILACSMLD